MWCAVGLHPRGKGSFSQVSKVLWQASAHACTAHADPDSTSPVSVHGKLHVEFATGIDAVYSCVCTRGGGLQYSSKSTGIKAPLHVMVLF